ncbi:hypothetical protein HELRODRAFT_168460 [Helobdella robusta]|uniref:Uncharacterized protein n=1 Tax=Helobdella robusta TaxID=6412 RepID=T1F0L9_HELRO|nr:hypothetical protein HELRODRAFT_168460 [Helobdella robusta]ESO09474.1 hypothetical protein HELRODRAFT_168460 [Helobdella robusta]
MIYERHVRSLCTVYNIITVCLAGFLMLSQGHVPSTTSLTLCHVCYKHFKVGQDGTLVRHGGKVKGSECPGSLKHPPSSRKRRSLNVVNANISKTSEDSRVLDTAVDMKSKSSLAEKFVEKSSGCRLVDHVPKQSRGKFGRMLKDILNNICDNPSNAILWFRLLFIPRLILRKDLRGGGKKNISAKINSRLDAFGEGSLEELMKSVEPIVKGQDERVRKPKLSALVKCKIEQGNVRNAMRILASTDTMAPDSTDTINSLKDKHPPAPLDRKPSPNKESTSVTVNPQQIMLCLRQFPKGTSGGRDGLTPQHLRDLTHDKIETSELISAMTGFINLLLSGVCPPERTLLSALLCETLYTNIVC